MNVNVQQLASELASELAEFKKLNEIINDAQARIGAQTPGAFELYALAGILHDLYHGMENLCYHVARKIDQANLSGSSWHRDLIDLVSKPAPNLRPAVLRTETAAQMHEYRAFRHRVRHTYGFDLEWKRMQPLFDNAPSMIALIVTDFEQFINFLRMMGK